LYKFISTDKLDKLYLTSARWLANHRRQKRN